MQTDAKETKKSENKAEPMDAEIKENHAWLTCSKYQSLSKIYWVIWNELPIFENIAKLSHL